MNMMPRQPVSLAQIPRAADLRRRQRGPIDLSGSDRQQRGHPSDFCLDNLAGRLVELTGTGAIATLSLTLGLIREAQQRAEPAAWITTRGSSFFPPDAALYGVDLAALPVIFVPDVAGVTRAAVQLGRSGAFALIVADLIDPAPPVARRGGAPHDRNSSYNRSRSHSPVEIPLSVQSQLAGLAQKHDSTIVVLTRKASDLPSLGSLVSLRCETRRQPVADGHFLCVAHALKDKTGPAGWSFTEVRRGPLGLC